MADDQSDEFFNFEEALDQLRLKEEELKRLVSEGEIRAFRKGETMRLRRADVEHLKNELLGGDVVDLGGDGEELVFEDDVDLDETGMATEEIGDMDTLLEADVEDVGLGDVDLGTDMELGDADMETGLDLEDVEDVGTVAEADELEDLGAPAGARAPVRRASAIDGGAEETSEGMGMRAALIATSLVLILAIPVVISVSSGSPGQIAKMIAGLFGKDVG